MGVKAWFDEFGGLSYFNATARKSGLWLQWCLLESKADRLSVARKRLLPTRMPRSGLVDLPDVSGSRTAGRLSPLRRRVEYSRYVISRLGYHARILPPRFRREFDGGGRQRNWGGSSGLLGCFVSFRPRDVHLFLLYNLYLLDRGFKEDLVGLVVSATAIGSVIGTIPAGMLARRLGLKKSLLLCMAAGSTISALRSVLATRTSLLALAFLGGARSRFGLCAFRLQSRTYE